MAKINENQESIEKSTKKERMSDYSDILSLTHKE